MLAQTTGQNTGSSYAHWTQNTHYKLSSPIAANVLGDDLPELILGNEIYTVNITNPAGQSGNDITLAAQITPPGGATTDGHAQVADFNADGFLDILVSVRSTYAPSGTVYAYVWDVHNGTTSNPLAIPTTSSGKSFATIADIDNDEMLELLIQSGVQGTNQRFQAYKYQPGTGTFSLMWGFATDEDSFSNAITTFDFNQDGLLELLICDQSTVRIVNGSGVSHITHQDTVPVYVVNSFPFSETTIMQYPVIADVDADGSAEFVSVGSNRLNIFKSAAAIGWAPARKVWNQYLYNVTNVNEDLTIPQYLFNNATPFTGPDNVTRRPFNNFLQQATTIDQNGQPFFAVPDIATNAIAEQYSEDSVCLVFDFCNIGDNTLNAPYPITVFINTYGGDTLCTIIVDENLPKDSCVQKSFCLSINDMCNTPNLDILVFAVNCAGAGIAQNGGLQPECETGNNLVSLDVSVQSDTTHIFVSACDSYLWIDGITYTEDSDTATLTLTNEAGCDSIVRLHLSIHHPVEVIQETTICKSALPYHWNGLTFTEEGTMTLALQTAQGCDSTVTMTLNTVDDHLQIVMLSNDPCDDFSADLLAQTDMSQFQWSTGETTSQITVYHSGTYYVTASDGNCFATDAFFVPECDFQLYLPNAISATEDNGVNDCFFVPQHSQRQIRDFEIAIYNRWGQTVFHSEDKNFRWYGHSNGKVLPNTSYTYVIRCTNYNGRKYHFKGAITVL